MTVVTCCGANLAAEACRAERRRTPIALGKTDWQSVFRLEHAREEVDVFAVGWGGFAGL
jgi:hypothetical protein